ERGPARGGGLSRRALRAIAAVSIWPTPCSSPPCSSLLARRASLGSLECGSSPQASAWRCLFLPLSECSSCPRPESRPFLKLQSQIPNTSMSANLEQHDGRLLVLRVGGELKKSELDAAQSKFVETIAGAGTVKLLVLLEHFS